MAKRFLDSELFRKEWFRKLSPKLKCAWLFIILEAKETGEIEISEETVKYHVGSKVTIEEITETVSKSDSIKLIPLEPEKNKFFITGYLSFQYKNLSYASPPHKPIIDEMEKLLLAYPKLNLGETFPKGFRTPLEIEKEKEKVKVKEKEREKEKEKARLQKEIENFKKNYPEEYAGVNS